MSKTVKEHYNKIAGIYDSIYENNLYWEYYDKITWLHIKKFLTNLPINSNILDAGCGTGKWGLKLAKSGYNVTFLDISSKMLEQAKRKYESMGFDKEVKFINTDIVDLNMLNDESYELVILQGDVLGSCNDIAKALKELYRILKNNGIIIASVDNKAKALEFYLKQQNIQALKEFIRTGKTYWVKNSKESFKIKMFSKEEIYNLFIKHNFNVISLIGKVILPIKQYQHLLQNKEDFLELIELEMNLNYLDSYIPLANHIEIVGQKKI